MKTNAQFYLNDYVTVHLTGHGVNILRKRHNDLEFAMSSRNLRHQYREFVPPENNMYTAQMWYLMQVFGEYMGLAKENPFALSITLHNVYCQKIESNETECGAE